MKLYYHHVGQAGAERDFPKTVRELQAQGVERRLRLVMLGDGCLL